MKRIALSLACLGLLAPYLTANSITITAPSIKFVGIESGTTVENWSNPLPVIVNSVDFNDKTMDINGDNRFGGAGFYQITPYQIEPGGPEDTWGVVAPDDNDLGMTQITQDNDYQTKKIQPPFIVAHPVGEDGDFINLYGSPFFQNANATGTVRQGALRLNHLNKQPGIIGESINGWRSKAFKFILSESASFRLGVVVDTLSDGYYAPDYVSVFNVVTGERFSTTLLDRDGVADMVFFDIGGNFGDSFEVALWQTDDNDARIAFSLVTFDQAPIPTLTYSQEGDNITLSWEANIPGWILESSTDLGVSDDWEPVLGVNYVTKSVTLDTSTKSKSFFRWTKNL